MNWRGVSTLQWALGISVLLHAALLTIRFVDPESFNRVFKDTPLEVILVNAGSEEKPENAQVVAQRSLAGGGDLEKKVRATSPLPPSAFNAVGDSAEDTRRQIDTLQQQQVLLLAQVKEQLARLPTADPKQTSDPSERTEQEEKRKQLLKLLAEIERRVNEESARPKRRYVSPATREAAYALYVDTVRRRIEARGTENFPETGGKKLYGELTMVLTIDSDGSLATTTIVESSGNRVLDRQAQAIARSLGSFGRFTPAMLAETDQILLPSRFKFTREERLEAQSSTR